ncbi:hypothetical protein ORI89_18590 [Sphingobacterium sp. UT-1RO-CII-1]|uniref:hypothetical protein n=1 Tax=Sphingobacterium sp. UT-1RO-CII-1 TaxID=2995225 RepID=UPI00227B613F|nr:hypothetical protein [Sphingobacterium sp. UT-1RO-CII-1]MCY4781668.1 hypothetical protein [Sphingobacterium sp. UT-1RO-CII-1]
MNIQCQFLPEEWANSIDKDESAEELNNYIKDQLLLLSPNKDKPIKFQDLFVDLFGREWKFLAYKCAIDEMVRGKICNSSQQVNLVLCKMNELELIVKVCYLMYLKLKVKKTWGQLHINYSHV